MRIKEIHIDGFGVWNGLALKDLSDRAMVVYGPNEAGKTTLMQFIRAVLYGFTPERRKRYLPPVHGGNPGGRLRLANEFGSFVVRRHEGNGKQAPDDGVVEITDDRGEPRDAGQLQSLLTGVDEPTYSNVFAVGLKEIQELGSLDDTAAADYLYRLTSGLDRVSLVDVIREVEAARQRLLASDEKATSQIPQLATRQGKLRAKIDEFARHAKRWNDLAAQRTKLVEEANQLDQQIAQIEAASRLLRAALDVQEPWNQRTDVQRQLESLKAVRPLPERSEEKLDAVKKLLATCRGRLKKLRARKGELQKDLDSLEINQGLLDHAGRIESLHDQSQWIGGLETQIARLRDEVAKLDTEIEAAVSGYRSAGTSSLDELPRDTVSVLRRPAQVVREENEKLHKARQEADEAKRALEAAAEQYEQATRSKHLTDLNKAIQDAEAKVALLRKRIAMEQRQDQLTRRRQELEVENGDFGAYDDVPLRVTALVGLFFALGIMFMLMGTVGAWYDYISSGWPYAMFGFIAAGLSIFGKVMMQRNADDHLGEGFRQLEHVRVQLVDLKRERDELDVELPAGGGSLDTRLREAEVELRDLQRLIPVRTERDNAQERHDAAERRLTSVEQALKEARHRWKNALRSVGMPEDFAPPKAKQVVKNNEQVLELRRRRDTRKDELDERQRELLVITSRLAQILDDVRHSCKSDRPIERINELADAVAKEKETLALRENVQRQLRKLARSRDKLIASWRKASRQRHALLTMAAVENEKDFRQAAADWARVNELTQQHAELASRIQATLAGQFTEDVIADVFAAEGRHVEARFNEQQKQLADIRARLAQLHERRGACVQEMQSLASDRHMGRALLELNTVEVQLADAIRRWKILTIIARLLEAVRQHYETDRQPETLREASQYLARLTDGHYHRIWMPLDRRGLLIENALGQSLSLDVLSRGTREAVLICLRLALARSFARRGAALPLVLDDVLVNFDSSRVRCAAEVLCEFAKSGHQVIMFTCHEHITEIFRAAAADVRILPSRTGKAEVVGDLPPPTPSVTPEDEPEPLRTRPEIDPNPLLQMAAAAEQLFDPVHPLPDTSLRSKRKKRREPERAAISRPQPRLPDFWPIANVAKVDPAKLPPPVADTFEILAFRVLAENEPIVLQPTDSLSQGDPETVIVSAADPSLPSPEHLASRQPRQRFTWDSPEMYWDGGD
jgi:uncharacterized protein YhaN